MGASLKNTVAQVMSTESKRLRQRLQGDAAVAAEMRTSLEAEEAHQRERRVERIDGKGKGKGDHVDYGISSRSGSRGRSRSRQPHLQPQRQRQLQLHDRWGARAEWQHQPIETLVQRQRRSSISENAL